MKNRSIFECRSENPPVPLNDPMSGRKFKESRISVVSLEPVKQEVRFKEKVNKAVANGSTLTYMGSIVSMLRNSWQILMVTLN
jgi:hypothetical protein